MGADCRIYSASQETRFLSGSCLPRGSIQVRVSYCISRILCALLMFAEFIPELRRSMSTTDTLESLITAGRLLEIAGEVTYARGAAYAREGRVRDMSIQDGVLTARVDGSETYRARLFKQGPRLDFDCTCPVGNELRFCKHCVAAGLAWLMAQAEPALDGSTGREDPLDRVGAVLDHLDAPALRALLLDEARVHEPLCDRLLMREGLPSGRVPAAAGARDDEAGG